MQGHPLCRHGLCELRCSPSKCVGVYGETKHPVTMTVTLSHPLGYDAGDVRETVNYVAGVSDFIFNVAVDLLQLGGRRAAIMSLIL